MPNGLGIGFVAMGHGCDMWVTFENSGVGSMELANEKEFEFVCQKCLRVKELEARLVEWEWVLKDEWRLVEDGPSGVVSEELNETVITNNFRCLDVEEVGEEVADCTDGEVSHKGGRWHRDKKQGSVLLVGDSLVRFVDREFSRGKKDKRVRVCLPGARIEDVSGMVNEVVGDEEVVVLEVGTNNFGREPNWLIRSRYRELLLRLKATRAKVVCCGVLPRFDNKVNMDRLVDFNSWLEEESTRMGFSFVDTWVMFQNKRDLFARDGLHLVTAGADEFGRMINRAVDGLSLN